MSKTRSDLLTTRMQKNLRALRTVAGLSQEAMADKCGVNREVIGSIEEGRVRPSIEVLIGYSEHFDISIDHLVLTDIYSGEVIFQSSLNQECGKQVRKEYGKDVEEELRETN